MSVYSMTGYGSAASSGDSDTQTAPSVGVEVRSVNGRFLDVTIKTSDDARGLETALRELVASRVKRGKVELRVAAAREAEGAWQGISPEMLLRLARMESSVQGFLPKAAPLSVHEALQWCRQALPASTRTDEATLEVAGRALDAMIEARRREGERLATSLRAQLLRLRELAAKAQPLVGAVVQRQQQRFLERWREALATTGGSEVSPTTAQERALSEAATYALRIDVAEELTRLKAHFDELEALLDKGGELGKRLDFLVQELHREANTLGAKSQSIELTAISMDMRVMIEQMREQVQNIE